MGAAIGETRHEVTMARRVWERLTAGNHAPEIFIEAAFRFLLDREPKESILRSFDLTVIGRYFPEYEHEIRRNPGPVSGCRPRIIRRDV